MKKLLLMIPLMIVLVLSLTLTSFAASSAPSNVEYPVYAPSQAPLQFSFAVGDYPNTEGLQVPTKYNLFMDVGSPVVSFGTTYSNIKLWNNALGIEYSFRTAVSVGNGVNGITLSKGNASDRVETFYPEFTATGNSFVYQPSLVQGRYSVGSNISFGSSIRPYADLIHQRVIYSGSLLYPTTDGSFIPVPFLYESELYSGAAETVILYRYEPAGEIIVEYEIASYPVASNYGCSLVPSNLTYNGNADKLDTLEVFTIAFQLASSQGITNLIRPNVLADYNVPVAFASYSLHYSIEGSSVASHTDFDSPGEDVIDNRLWYGGTIKSTGFNVTVPSTLNGIPRDNETLSDFIYTVFPEFDLDFSFVEFITTIIVGVLTVEIFPGFFLYTALSVVVAISLIIWLLKVFAGG